MSKMQRQMIIVRVEDKPSHTIASYILAEILDQSTDKEGCINVKNLIRAIETVKIKPVGEKKDGVTQAKVDTEFEFITDDMFTGYTTKLNLRQSICWRYASPKESLSKKYFSMMDKAVFSENEDSDDKELTKDQRPPLAVAGPTVKDKE